MGAPHRPCPGGKAEQASSRKWYFHQIPEGRPAPDFTHKPRTKYQGGPSLWPIHLLLLSWLVCLCVDILGLKFKLGSHTTTSHSPLASPQAQVYDLPSGGLVQVKGPCRPRSGPGLFGQGMQQACIYRGEWYESRCIANGQTCFFHPTGFSMERSTAGCGGVGLLKHKVWGRDPDCRV